MRIERPEYLKELQAWQGKQIIKVITGVRRCGKSVLMEMYAEWLREQGVPKKLIVEVNLEKLENEALCQPLALHSYIKKRLSPKEMTYVFIDEVQLCKEFPRVVDSLYITPNTDIYITGSNANLLSSELATMLSGRYVEIRMLPLSFREFAQAHPEIRERQRLYTEYISTSSFPYVLELPGTRRELDNYLEGIYNTILVNVGTTKNAGVEVSLDYDVISKKDFKWTTGANWSMGDTKLTKLSSDVYKAAYLELYQKPGLGTSEYFFRVEEGGKIGQFFGYEHAGVDENGLLLVYDNDGNARPAAQADPTWKRNIGNGAPKHFLSWTNSFKYKNWDLSMLMRGAFGFKIFNMRKYGMGLQGAGTDNVLRTAYTDDADVKSSGGIITSYFLENGNYFKMDNVTLGYSFIPKKREIIESLRVYLTAKNLFTITAYKGNDPSIVTSTGIEPGVDSNSAYPQATQLTLGVTVRFH